jgi:hypothetical protein
MDTRKTPRWVALVAIAALGLVASPARAAVPAAPTLVAPGGAVPAGLVVFTWQAAADATFYYLQVNDATASPRFTAWYPAGQACPAGSATCTATVTTGWAVGGATWWIHGWNPEGYGPWSAGMGFAVSHVQGAWSHDLPAGQRFQLVFGGDAVLDRVTGLVWERTPSPATEASWQAALTGCLLESTAIRYGWRLPTIDELQTLQDFTQSPRLPAGHPFAIVNGFYWSATTYAPDPTRAMAGSFDNVDPNFFTAKSTTLFRRWCVLGGQTSQSPQ